MDWYTTTSLQTKVIAVLTLWAVANIAWTVWTIIRRIKRK